MISKEDLRHMCFMIGSLGHIVIITVLVWLGCINFLFSLQMSLYRMYAPETYANGVNIALGSAVILGHMVGVFASCMAFFAALWEWGEHFNRHRGGHFFPVYILWGALAPPISTARWLYNTFPSFMAAMKTLQGRL